MGEREEESDKILIAIYQSALERRETMDKRLTMLPVMCLLMLTACKAANEQIEWQKKPSRGAGEWYFSYVRTNMQKSGTLAASKKEADQRRLALFRDYGKSNSLPFSRR
jgi:hypothetical protein